MPRKLVRSEEEPEPEPEDEPLLYDAVAAGKILGGISRSMVYRYVQFGQLHPVKLGARSLFSREELQRFVRDRQAEAEAG